MGGGKFNNNHNVQPLYLKRWFSWTTFLSSIVLWSLQNFTLIWDALLKKSFSKNKKKPLTCFSSCNCDLYKHQLYFLEWKLIKQFRLRACLVISYTAVSACPEHSPQCRRRFLQQLRSLRRCARVFHSSGKLISNKKWDLQQTFTLYQSRKKM